MNQGDRRQLLSTAGLPRVGQIAEYGLQFRGCDLVALIVARRQYARGEEGRNEDGCVAFLGEFLFETVVAGAVVIVGQTIAKVEIQEDDSRRRFSRKIRELSDEPPRRIV